MAPRKKPAPRKKSASSSRTKPRARTQALAITDAVKRELPASPFLGAQLLGAQEAWLRRAAVWSPLGLLVAQQAAFWKGFTGEETERRAPQRKSSRTR